MSNQAASVLAALLSLASSAVAAQETREQSIAELIQAAGIEDLLARTQQRSAAEARHMVDGMLAQVGDLMARLPADRRERLKAAVDHLLATTTAPIDTRDAAADQLRTYLEEKRAPVLQKAVNDYVAELRAIVATGADAPPKP